MSLTSDIKDFALDLGYSAVGITTAEPFPLVAEELAKRQEDYRWVVDGRLKMLEGTTPTRLMPEARSIITTVYDYGAQGFPSELVGRLGRLYQSRSYNAPRHRIQGARRQLFREFLEGKGLKVMLGPDLNVAERMAAARAGAVTFGRNNFAYTKEAGSFVVILSFTVDAELEYDQPTVEAPCPKNCRLCIDACPTGALEPFKLNPRKCIAFNNMMTQDGYGPSLSDHIAPSIREKMGSWLHGCDVCQEVCPRNQRRLKAKLPVSEFLALTAARFDLRKVLLLTDEYYESVLRPVAYNYLRHKKYFQRNAAMALGNSGDRSHVPFLAQALADPEPLVRGYAAWALGRLGGSEAGAALERALCAEVDDMAKQEIASALAS
jgi:epoxyqueuosine reductase